MLYLRYEERYLLGAPDLKSITRRLAWAPDSPALQPSLCGDGLIPQLDYEVRAEHSDTP